MMASACRGNISVIDRGQGENAGLLLSKYLKVAYKDDDHPDDRGKLFDDAIGACKRAGEIYRHAYERWKGFVNGAEKELYVKGRLIIGLGGESVLETGITLNHTYGTPYVPGSALKGLAAHYCNNVWGDQNEEYRIRKADDSVGEYYRILFGTNEYRGHILFHDAWMVPDSGGLQHDVMTPHHGDYYSGRIENGKDTPPTDFDDPNPVTFLSVAGKFRFVVSCDATGNDDQSQWATLAMSLLQEALESWGVGGKTSSDYGVFSEMGQYAGRGEAAVIANGENAAPRRGDKVTVRRVDDPKGKGRSWFEDNDHVGGVVVRGTPPDVDVEAECELWVMAYSRKGYNFSSEQVERPNNNNRGRRR